MLSSRHVRGEMTSARAAFACRNLRTARSFDPISLHVLTSFSKTHGFVSEIFLSFGNAVKDALTVGLVNIRSVQYAAPKFVFLLRFQVFRFGFSHEIEILSTQQLASKLPKYIIMRHIIQNFHFEFHELASKKKRRVK